MSQESITGTLARPSVTSDDIIVAFGVDLAYAPHLATTLTSIVANAPGAHFHFMIIHDGIPDTEKRKIEAGAKGQSFHWHEITDSRVLAFETRDYISRATYYRFAIPEFAPAEAKRVIYIDSDTVVLADLCELWHADLGGKPIAAVWDGGISATEFADRWQLPQVELGYFNAGIMVLDLEQIRAGGLFDQAVSHLQTRWNDFPWGDQDALNLLFWDNWTRLDPAWNCQRRMLVHLTNAPEYSTPENMRATGRPKIVHYTEAYKPWLPKAWHPLTWLYFRYLKRTPYWKSVNQNAETTPVKLLRHFIRTQLTLSRLKS